MTAAPPLSEEEVGPTVRVRVMPSPERSALSPAGFAVDLSPEG